MGLLDELASKAQGMFGSAEGESSGLLNNVMEMLSNRETGGLNGLVQSFKDRGLDDVVSSWVGKGENLPVNADQISNVLGSETIQNLAAKAGVSSSDLSSMLAQHLPGLIDRLTPDGVIPEGGIMEKGLAFLKGKLS